jgi:putative phosphoribosyl transferase
LLADLLTVSEETDRSRVFDITLLASRLAACTRWAGSDPRTMGLPQGYFGASTGAAAALVAAASLPQVGAVVSRGGRPDLAGRALSRVKAPVLLIVGSADSQVLQLNRRAQRELGGAVDLSVIPGATHLFEEAGALDVVAAEAADWFARYLAVGGLAA